MLALALRVPGLDSGLWFDEVVTLVESVRLPLLELLGTYGGENNHPLYSLLASLSVGVFGEAAWSLRLPAFLFGVASVPVLYWFARRITGPREALLAAALLATSYHHVWFSQNARGYTMLLFFTLVGSGLLHDGLENRGRRRSVAAGLVMALALYTHLTAVFVLAGQAAAVLVYGLGSPSGWIRTVRRAVPAFLSAAVGAVVLYAPILPQVAGAFARRFQAASAPEQQDFATVKVDAWTDPWWAFLAMIEQLGAWLVIAAMLVAVVLLVGALSLWKSQRWFLALVGVPAVLGAAVLLVLQRHFYPRFFFFAAGFALLLLVLGLRAIAGWAAKALEATPARTRALFTMAGLMVVVASLVLLPRNYRWPKQDFAGARDHVEARRGPGSAVVTAGLARFPYAEFYAPEWGSVESVDEIRALRETCPELWLVFYDRTYMRSVHPALLDCIDAEFERVEQFPGTVGGGTLHVCRFRGR